MNKVYGIAPLAGTEDDRRVRLTDALKADIRQWHKDGASIHEIARTTGISRRAIQFLLFPERLEASLLARELRGGSKAHYKRAAHTAAMRRHRAHKREVAEKRTAAPSEDSAQRKENENEYRDQE